MPIFPFNLFSPLGDDVLPSNSDVNDSRVEVVPDEELITTNGGEDPFDLPNPVDLDDLVNNSDILNSSGFGTSPILTSPTPPTIWTVTGDLSGTVLDGVSGASTVILGSLSAVLQAVFQYSLLLAVVFLPVGILFVRWVFSILTLRGRY